MSNVDVKSVRQYFQMHNNKITLFGFITVDNADHFYEVRSVGDSTTPDSVTVTFGPIQPSGTIPLEQQFAFVLGGVSRRLINTPLPSPLKPVIL
jgi:hypothetical protein